MRASTTTCNRFINVWLGTRLGHSLIPSPCTPRHEQARLPAMDTATPPHSTKTNPRLHCIKDSRKGWMAYYDGHAMCSSARGSCSYDTVIDSQLWKGSGRWRAGETPSPHALVHIDQLDYLHRQFCDEGQPDLGKSHKKVVLVNQQHSNQGSIDHHGERRTSPLAATLGDAGGTGPRVGLASSS